MKEGLIAAVLLALWFSLLIADVRAYPYLEGNGDISSSDMPSEIIAPICKIS